jgi:hypothetical protein
MTGRPTGPGGEGGIAELLDEFLDEIQFPAQSRA